MIYTVGYLNFLRFQLKEEMEELNSALIDIRFVPFSYSIFWNKNELERFFEGRYFYVGELGNINYKNGKKFTICDLGKGIKKIQDILEKYENCTLMCCCEEFLKCHRSLISQEIKKILGIKTIEILYVRSQDNI